MNIIDSVSGHSHGLCGVLTVDSADSADVAVNIGLFQLPAVSWEGVSAS